MNAVSVIDASWHPLADGCPPAWACGWGQDKRGVFVEFAVDEVVQRLRWIPPGRFMMDSPEDEPGRFADEGPRREVTVARGFWLFDTPCTQGLWRAVMGQNPSRFQSPDRPITCFQPDRPVETVSWNDVLDFLARINRRIPGLDLTLSDDCRSEGSSAQIALRAGNGCDSGLLEVRAGGASVTGWAGGGPSVRVPAGDRAGVKQRGDRLSASCGQVSGDASSADPVQLLRNSGDSRHSTKKPEEISHFTGHVTVSDRFAPVPFSYHRRC